MSFFNVSVASVLSYFTFQRSKIQPMPIEFLYLTVLLIGELHSHCSVSRHPLRGGTLSMSKSGELSERFNVVCGIETDPIVLPSLTPPLLVLVFKLLKLVSCDILFLKKID